MYMLITAHTSFLPVYKFSKLSHEVRMSDTVTDIHRYHCIIITEDVHSSTPSSSAAAACSSSIRSVTRSPIIIWTCTTHTHIYIYIYIYSDVCQQLIDCLLHTRPFTQRTTEKAMSRDVQCHIRHHYRSSHHEGLLNSWLDSVLHQLESQDGHW